MKKNQTQFSILGVFASIVFFSFSIKTDDSVYEKEIKSWHQNRVEGLKKENGWLNLAGLFWLEEGRNSFGGNSENKIVFPKDRSKAFLGDIVLSKGEVFVETKADADVFSENGKIEKLKLFPAEKSIILKHNSLRLFVIKRGERFAIRLRDLESPFLKKFHGIETFKIDPKWKLKAKFVPTEGKKIAILDITGQTSQQDSPGVLVFTISGKEYKLDALAEGEEFFVIFGDKTNKKETYGAGRFVYTAKPDADGFTYLDFNKAHNPPCAFTPYATCPLPPKQNLLPIEIKAGEKNYGNH
jgi:uncharacterized protein (DUF1684 family)